MMVIPFPSPKDFAPPAIATDAMVDLIFSLILDREAELVELAPISFARCAGSCGDCAARARGGGP